jgi:hypothetical protein
MIPVLSLLTAQALATPLSPAHLTAAEEQATAMIDRCERYGRACGASAEALGRAFLARATTAAVLRGELDSQAVADATLLAPHAVEVWRDLLPSAAEVGPSPWVIAWLDEPQRAVSIEPGPPEPAVVAPEPEDSRRSGGTVVRGTGVRSLDAPQSAGTIEARTSVGRVGLMIDATWARYAIPETAVPEWDGYVLPEHAQRTVVGRASVGPRWIGPGGGEVMPYAGVSINNSGVFGPSLSRLVQDANVQPSPPIWSVGSHIGLLTVRPLAPGAAWSVRTSAAASVGHRWRRSRDPGPYGLTWPDLEAPTTLSGVLQPELQWTPSALILAAGPAFAWDGVLGRPMERPSVGIGATVGWRLQ